MIHQVSSSHHRFVLVILFVSLLSIFPFQGVDTTRAGTLPLGILTRDGTSRIADVAENSINGVVNISSTKVITTGDQHFLSPFYNDPFFREFFGQRFFGIPLERRERSLGSGVIVSKEGLVLTNNHVVENAEEILVTLADKRELEAEIVGTDPKSDVAVIRLKGDIGGLTPLPIGNSAELRLGDVVLAIGNPFGLDHTVTMGIVSAKGRANVGIADYEDFIQTDAAINPGNSGGALVNLKGELIGINTAIVSKTGGYQGIGFAIPSNMARAVMENLAKHGKVIQGWLGISTQDLDTNLARALGMKDTRGVLVSDVLEDSPAAKAQLRRGDVILRINGEPIDDSKRFSNTIAAMGAGFKVELIISRDGREKRLLATLAPVPEKFDGRISLADDDGVLGGMTIATVNDIIREKFTISKRIRQGVAITQMESGSLADQAGLKPGDVILEINRRNVATVADFEKIYERTRNNLLLLIYRQGNTMYLVLRK